MPPTLIVTAGRKDDGKRMKATLGLLGKRREQSWLQGGQRSFVHLCPTPLRAVDIQEGVRTVLIIITCCKAQSYRGNRDLS